MFYFYLININLIYIKLTFIFSQKYIIYCTYSINTIFSIVDSSAEDHGYLRIYYKRIIKKH